MTYKPSQNEPSDADDLPGAITKTPDGKLIRQWRRRLDGCHWGWPLKVFEYIVVPAQTPQDFNQPLSELRDELATDDPITAAASLVEAEAIFREPNERIESAERRATTLQGTVAIAASIVIASAGLLLESRKIAGHGWRVAFVILLAAFVASLVACAWRALGVTGRMFEFEQPGPERIGMRAKLNGPAAQTFRAAELLRAAGVADEIAAVKVGLLRAAAWWLRVALGVLAAFAVALALYVVVHEAQKPHCATPRCKQVGRLVAR